MKSCYIGLIAVGAFFFWMVTFLFGIPGRGQIAVGDFSSLKPGGEFPETWKALTFKNIENRTSYTLVDDDGTTVVMAKAEASASGLIREIRVDPQEYPLIQWRWKALNVLDKGDVHLKSGDDYPARIYITFESDPDKLEFVERLKYRAIKLIYGRPPPSKAVNYIWADKAPKGTMIPNAYTDSVMMIVIESGHNNLNHWISEQRNIYKDYKKAFADEPPAISGVAIMTDSDNTKETATAYYGDIFFMRDKPFNVED